MEERDFWMPGEKSKWQGILIKTAIILVVLAGILVVIKKMNPPEEVTTEAGITRIRELEAEDVEIAQNYIKGIREQWTRDEAMQIAGEAAELKKYFEDYSVLIMGDDIVKGFIDYGVLDSEIILATEGGSVGDSAAVLNKALGLSPWNFIIAYGINDVITYNGDETAFIEAYKELAGTFKAMRPNAVVYLCEIPPVSTDAVSENEAYKNIKVFNEAIRRLCKKQGYVYLETANLISDYDGSGILPNYAFYSSFVESIKQSVEEHKNVDVIGRKE